VDRPGQSPEDLLHDQVKRIKEADRASYREECELAVRYLNNNQVEDVTNELSRRYPLTQDGGFDQRIQPVVVPLAERYIAESASLYNHGVTRKLTLPGGEENERTKKLTSGLSRELGRMGYDEVMHANERHVVALRTSCVWFQMHRDELRPVVTLPHHVYPVAPSVEQAAEMAVNDPKDYAGFVIETVYDREVYTSAQGAMYVYVTADKTVAYTGSGPNDPEKILVEHPHKFGRNPLTFWHMAYPVNELLCSGDALIARANREINVAWSMLFDLLKMQGFAVPVKKVTNKNEPGARQAHGSRFPVVLNLEEEFKYETADAPYEKIVSVLREYAKLLAICVRENPETFSADGAVAVSGFSKLVSSLPKIEARQERARRAKAVEEQQAGPLLIRGLIMSGKLPAEAENLELDVSYQDIEFPRTPDEVEKDLETKFHYGLSTPVKELAQRRHIAIDAARSEVEANLKEIEEMGIDVGPFRPSSEQSPMRDTTSQLFGSLINKAGNKQQPMMKPDQMTGKGMGGSRVPA
jgi:hypothetical protein